MTIDAQVRDALAAYDELSSLGEDIDDEWTYVTDLSTAWRERIEEVVAQRGAEPVAPPAQAAIAGAICGAYKGVETLPAGMRRTVD